MTSLDYAIAITKILVEVVSEAAEVFLWRTLLDENVDEIRSGTKINEAEQELKPIENDINYASIILAGAIDKPKEVCDWIDKAQKAAFSLEDQIAMYRIKGSNEGLLVFRLMKSAIGKLSIERLTSTIKDCIREKPDAMKDESMDQLCEMYPFIRNSNHTAADGKVRIMKGLAEKLKDLVDSDNASVIFIIGGKGSGRTTLMRSVYEDSHVKGSFGPRSWVEDAAKITDLVGLLRKVLKVKGSAEDQEGSAEDQESISELEIMSKIQGTFHGKGKGRYLIVLDDVEDTGALHTLKHILKGCKGKIVCLTTRRNINEDVQEDIKKDSKTLTISPLEENDAHELLMRAAFPGFDGDEFKEAIEWRADKKLTDVDKNVTILNQVLEKCKGNPWNIRTVGKLLAAYPLERWEEIPEKIDSMLIDGNRGIEKLDPRPPIQLDDLKLLRLADWRSFLYCLAFPEGSEISVQKLVRLWIAEGFVQDSPLHSQEHEAESLLQGLIRKNLLVEKKKSLDGKVLKCSVNKDIRPLALEMCKLQKFCRFVPEPNNPLPASFSANSSSPRYRVFSVHGDIGVREVSDSETLRKDIPLRSLLYFGTGRMQREEFNLSFRGRPYRRRTFRLLRTLELQGARLGRLSRSIGCLVCLRYLGLRNTELKELPASFHSLKKLLCLDIRDNYITSLDDVSAFKEMRHLHLAKSFRSQSVLIKEGLRSLVCLWTLSGAADGGNLEKELSSLGFLRKLSIKVSSASSKNICAAVSNMGLHSLAITAYSEDLEKENKNTSDGVEPAENKQATPERTRFDIGSLKIGENIRKLKLGGDMGTLSAERISMMHSLTHLYLWDSKLDVDVLLCLQGIRDLLLLSICNASTYSKLSCTQGGYRKLKKLAIVSMENLTECIFGTGAMKNLEELKFIKCDNLIGGSAKGLEHILYLKHVYLSEMHPDFVDSVKRSKPKDAQILETNMHLHKSRRPTTQGSQTTTPESINPLATETMDVNYVTLPRGAQNNIQSTESSNGAANLMGVLQSPQDSLGKGKGILIQNSSKDDSDANQTERKNQTYKEQMEQLMFYMGYEMVSQCMDRVFREPEIMEQSNEVDLYFEEAKNRLARLRDNEERTPEGSQPTAADSVAPLTAEGEVTQSTPPRCSPTGSDLSCARDSSVFSFQFDSASALPAPVTPLLGNAGSSTPAASRAPRPTVRAQPTRQSARIAAKSKGTFVDMTSQAVRRKALINNLAGCSPGLKKQVAKRSILSRNKLPLGVSDLRKLVSAAGLGCANVSSIGVSTDVA